MQTDVFIIMFQVALETFGFWTHLAESLHSEGETLNHDLDDHVQGFVVALCNLCQMADETVSEFDDKLEDVSFTLLLPPPLFHVIHKTLILLITSI